MARINTKIDTCGACGTEVRDAALFCYHCGSAISVKESQKEKPKSGALLRKSLIDDKNTVVEIEREKKDDLAEVDEVMNSGKAGKAKDNSGTNGKGEIKLRSAASIRNRAKRLEPRKIETIWEEHENKSNIRFVLVSIGLAIFSLAIFFIAMYLK